MRVNLQITNQNYTDYVRKWNNTHEEDLKAQIRGPEGRTALRLIEVFKDNYNAGKCPEGRLKTSLYSIGSQTQQHQRTIRRHIETLYFAGIITGMEIKRDGQWYWCKLELNPKIVHFEENQPVKQSGNQPKKPLFTAI